MDRSRSTDSYTHEPYSGRHYSTNSEQPQGDPVFTDAVEDETYDNRPLGYGDVSREPYRHHSDDEGIEAYPLNEDAELGQSDMRRVHDDDDDDDDDDVRVPSKQEKSSPLKKITALFPTKSKKKYTPQKQDQKPSTMDSIKRIFSRKEPERSEPVEPLGVYPASAHQPHQTSNRPQSAGQPRSAVDEVKNFLFNPPPRKMQSWVQQGPDIAEMKPVKEKSHIRSSTILWAILIAALLSGIIMSACSSKGEAMEVLGPTFICLSLIAMVGKCFFSLIWESEPFPRLTPYVEKYEEKFAQNRTKTPEKLMPWDERVRMNYVQRHDVMDTSYPYPARDSTNPSDPSSSLAPGTTAADIRYPPTEDVPPFDSPYDNNEGLQRGYSSSTPRDHGSAISSIPQGQRGPSQDQSRHPTTGDPMYDNYPDVFDGNGQSQGQSQGQTQRQYAESDSDEQDFDGPPPPGAGVRHYPSDL